MTKKTIAKKTLAIKSNPPTLKVVGFSNNFKKMKNLTIIILVICFLALASSAYLVNMAHVDANQRAYFIAESGTLVGNVSSKDDAQSKYVEVKNHVKVFANLMFSFDEGNYTTNVEKALFLIGNDGRVLYNTYQEGDMLNNLVRNNASVTITIDSLQVDARSKPYRARIFIRQKIASSIGSQQNNIYADMKVEDVTRTETNPHGLRIEDFTIFNNDKIQ